MARPGKTKKKKSAPKRPVDAAKVAAVAAALPGDSGAVATLYDGELEALVTRLVAAGRGDAIGALAALGLSGARGKAVKRGAYLLEQRGVSVATPARQGVDFGPVVRMDAMPIMMAAPLKDAGRRFTFTVPVEGAKLLIVEAYFAMPEGLYRLTAAPSTTHTYGPWAAEMMGKPSNDDPALPERLAVSKALLDRKLGEIGAMVRRGRLGPEVDNALAKRLGTRMLPEHPALGLDLSRGNVLGVDDLGRQAHRLTPFHHHAPEVELRDNWGEFGGSSMIQGSEQNSMQRSVSEWAGQWGYDGIVELLLDLTSYYHALDDLDAARTFRDLATVEAMDERQAGIDAFLFDWALWFFRRDNRPTLA